MSVGLHYVLEISKPGNGNWEWTPGFPRHWNNYFVFGVPMTADERIRFHNPAIFSKLALLYGKNGLPGDASAYLLRRTAKEKQSEFVCMDGMSVANLVVNTDEADMQCWALNVLSVLTGSKAIDDLSIRYIKNDRATSGHDKAEVFSVVRNIVGDRLWRIIVWLKDSP